MQRRRGGRSSCFGISMYEERGCKGDEEEGGVVADVRLLDVGDKTCVGRTSRNHKGASRPVFLLSVTFSEATQRIEWSLQRHTIHEVGHKDLEATFLPTELPVLKTYAYGTFWRRWPQCITSAGMVQQRRRSGIFMLRRIC